MESNSSYSPQIPNCLIVFFLAKLHQFCNSASQSQKISQPTEYDIPNYLNLFEGA